MAERQLPKTRVIDGFGCVRRDLETHPLSVGDVDACFVCQKPVTYWGLESLNRGHRWFTNYAVECEHCGLLFMRQHTARCGWVDGWKPYYGFDKSHPMQVILDEAKRVLALPLERDLRPTTTEERDAWGVYADYLDDNDCPLNAAAIRRKYKWGI